MGGGGNVLVIDGGSTRLTDGQILGAVTANSVKIWARGNRATSFQVRYRIGAGPNTVVNGPALAAGDDYSAAITLGGLTPNTTYEYAVRLSGAELYVGTFRTLPVAGSPSVVRFAYGADISYWHSYRPHSIFGEISGYAPQFLILGGDNIYADGGVPVDESVTGYRHRYRETFNDPHLRGLLQDLPSFMMWDDHEIWNDYYPGGPGTSRYSEARQAFDEWQGSHNPTPATPGEIYYSFQAGGVALFVLDARSHRSNPNGAEGPAKSMLGAVQKQALFDWLKNSSAPFKFIVSSVPFSDCASTVNDAWDSFTTLRQEIVDFIATERISGGAFLTGDLNFSGIDRVP